MGVKNKMNTQKSLIYQRFLTIYTSDSDSEGHAFESHRVYQKNPSKIGCFRGILLCFSCFSQTIKNANNA